MGILILITWMLIIPLLAGGIAGAGISRYRKNLPFLWVTGQMLLWAVFQLICVPYVLRAGKFSGVVNTYCIITAFIVLLSVILTIGWFRAGKNAMTILQQKKDKKVWYDCLWLLFFALLLFQLLQAVRMTYSDGDDAYYVTIATIAEKSDEMYTILPYTGGTTGLDARHGLASFSLWIAFLSRISGIQAVSVAHVAVPLMLIPLTYSIFYLIGSRLCSKSGEKLPLFMVLTELLVLFGDYSIYTAEKFMIARSRQGKAALASVIIPMLFFLLLLILERLQEQQKTEWMLWLVLVTTVIAGCLCSTQGAELICLLIGIVGLCTAWCYRKWKILIPFAACCIPAVCYAVLYFLLSP